MYSFLEHLIASWRLKGGVLCSPRLHAQQPVTFRYLSGKNRLNNAKGNWWPNLTSPVLNDTKPWVAFTWCQGEGRIFATKCVLLLHPGEGSAGASSQRPGSDPSTLLSLMHTLMQRQFKGCLTAFAIRVVDRITCIKSDYEPGCNNM